MSNPSAPHPDEAELLRFCDGELPPREAARIERHLEACWECRTQLEDIQKAISDYVRYRKDILQPELPPPPTAWRAPVPKLEPAAVRRPFFVPRFVYAAAAAVVVCVVVYRFNHTPSVSAAELLQKAVVAERSAAKPRRVQIRTKNKTQSPQDLEAMFHSAHYRWENPLSADAYAAWRDQLADKNDVVADIPEGYQIRTTTSSGTLAEATIDLRKQDLLPLRETLRFRNQDWVEISEAPESVQLAEAPAAPPDEPQPLPAVRSTPAIALATPGQELQVIATLHGMNADLGEPIEVLRRTDRIVVTATGLNPERQKQISASLAPLSNVELHFPAPPAPSSQAADSGRRVVSGGTPFETQLRDRLGGPDAFSKFADHVLEQSDSMMARAHALRALAERFPPDVEQQLNLTDRRLLANLRTEHAEALAHEAAGIESTMKPVLAELGAHAPTPMPALPAAWQPATEQLWTSAQATDRLLGALLAGSGSAPAEPLSSLAKALAQLETDMVSYKQLTPKP